MVGSCVAFGCRNEARKGSGIQFHSFPLKNQELLKSWINAIRRENWTPSKSSRICSCHFLEYDYQFRPGANVRLLKPQAVPSVFNIPSHIIKKPRERQVLVRHVRDEAKTGSKSVFIDDSRNDAHTQTHIVTREVSTQTTVMCDSESKRKIKCLHQKVRRQKRKIESLKSLFSELTKSKKDCIKLEEILENNFQDDDAM